MSQLTKTRTFPVPSRRDHRTSQSRTTRQRGKRTEPLIAINCIWLTLRPPGHRFIDPPPENPASFSAPRSPICKPQIGTDAEKHGVLSGRRPSVCFPSLANQFRLCLLHRQHVSRGNKHGDDADRSICLDHRSTSYLTISYLLGGVPRARAERDKAFDPFELSAVPSSSCSGLVFGLACVSLLKSQGQLWSGSCPRSLREESELHVSLWASLGGCTAA
jgi:hypothetical protein